MASRAINAARGLEVVGGASRLTGAELSQLNAVATKGIDAFQALGKDVPDSLKRMAAETQKAAAAGQGFTQFLGQANQLLGAFGISLSIGAVVGFGKELLNMADGIQKVADRTGLSTKEVQEFSYVAGQSGNTIEELTGALGQMQNRLVSGDKGAVGAVKALGLNLQALLDASPAEQMEQIATAFGTIPDPAQRTAAAMDLFGKSGAAILPTLISDFGRLRKEAPAMSDATVKALDTAGDSLARFGLQVKVWAAESYNFAGKLFDALIKYAYQAAASFTEVVIKIATVASKVPGASKVLAALGADIETLTKDAQWFRDAANAMAARTDAVASSANKAAPKLKLFNAETERATKSTEQARDKFEALADKVHALEAGLSAVPESLHKIGRGYDEAKLDQLAEAVGKIEQNAHIANFGFAGMVNSLKEVGTEAIKTRDELENFARFEFVGPIQQQTASLGTTLVGVFKGLPQLVVNALTGGGGIIGALKAVGSQIGSVLGTAIGKALGIGGPIGAAIGSLAGPLVGLFGKLFDNPEKQVNPIREQFVQLAGGLDALNKRAAAAGVTLKAMLDAKNPQQYEKAINDLNAALQFQDDAMATLQATVQKYGFTLEELGPAMQRQELDKQAQQLFKDWQVLNAAGIDTVAITGKMADSINEYVQNAVKMGVEVPSSMRPMLQAMVEQGKLTDASGNKIENLEDAGISFAQTMTEGFKAVVDSINKVVDAITRGLGTAIKNIPTPGPITIPVHFQVPNLPSPGSPITETAGVGSSLSSGARILPFPAGSVATAVAVPAGTSGAAGADISGQLATLIQMQAREQAEGPKRTARIVRDAVQTAVR